MVTSPSSSRPSLRNMAQIPLTFNCTRTEFFGQPQNGHGAVHPSVGETNIHLLTCEESRKYFGVRPLSLSAEHACSGRTATSSADCLFGQLRGEASAASCVTWTDGRLHPGIWGRSGHKASMGIWCKAHSYSLDICVPTQTPPNCSDITKGGLTRRPG
jgi:hypothetical protein